MPRKVIFFDRDGVINKDTKYPHKIKDFIFSDGIFDVMQKLDNDFSFIIVTNQSGINRGYYTKEDFDILNSWMLEQFVDKNIHILDVFFCPHTPSQNCKCRKPQTGMIDEACLKYDIDLGNSWLIGDNISDIECAINAGIGNKILVSQDLCELDCYRVNQVVDVLNIIS